MAANTGPITEVMPQPAWGVRDVAAERAFELGLHSSLVAKQTLPGLAEPFEIRLGKRALERLEMRIPGERPIRVGAKKRLDLSFAGGATPFGAARSSAGRTVWTGVIHSAGASALRFQFTGFDLPAGYELYLYSDEGQVRGPYTKRGPAGSGTFWSHTILASRVTLQLEGPEGGTPSFTIKRAGHMGPKFLMAAGAAAERGEPFAEKSFCSINEPCVENASCGHNSAVDVAEAAVAQILFPSQGGFYICTGGLLADTDNSTDRPIFLTANHCISKNNEASGSESFFDFSVNCGTTNCPSFTNGSFPSVAGASILSKGRSSDYTMLELSGLPDLNRSFMGWNSNPIANTNGVALYRISHPAGAPQAYSEHEVDTSKTTCGSWPRGNWIYSQDIYGATEGGSSGSPVLNGSGQVVGQLSGACGFDVNNPCNAADNATVDGALAAYFSNVAGILDPDGGDPGGGSCTPGSTPKGGSCTEDSDCQSCSCKGKPGSKTCK